MIYSVSGKLVLKGPNFAVIESGGLGLKVSAGARTLAGLRTGEKEDEPVKLYTHFHVREDAMELFGFLTEAELSFFEMLISVSGVGPKSALSILDVAKLEELSAAIQAGRPDLLTRASGIGRKTAERVIIELRTKVQSVKGGMVVEKMEADADLIEALSNLGYRREEARNALSKVESEVVDVGDRLKAALKLLSNNKNI